MLKPVSVWRCVLLSMLSLALVACGDSEPVSGGGGGSSARGTTLEITPAAVSRAAGDQQGFTATLKHADGRSEDVTAQVQWRSSASEVVSIDPYGLATAQRPGRAVIGAEHRGLRANARFDVEAAALVGIAVEPTPLSLSVGGTRALTAHAVYSDDTREPVSGSVVWSVSDERVARVDSVGIVTAVGAGHAQIRARLGDTVGASQLDVFAGPVPALPFTAGAAETAAPLAPFGSLCLGGYNTFCERNASAERDPLLVGAIAIGGQDGDVAGHLLLVKTTNIGYFVAYKLANGPNGIYDIRQRIARRVRALYPDSTLRADQIVVTSDHSHSGPDTIGLWGYVPPGYLAALAQAAVDAGVRAYAERQYTRLYAGRHEGPETQSSYRDGPSDKPDREFRVLYANSAHGRRVATLMNYAPHATVLPSKNTDATGDWTAWAAQEAALRSGGIGLGMVGSLGAMDWRKTGEDAEREAEARQRLRTMLDAAVAGAAELTDPRVSVRTTFVREPLGQPVLALNLAPPVGAGDFTVRIERAELPPWNTGGAVLGTYAAAARVGDVLLATYPGEPFPELHYALCRDLQSEHCENGVSDARLVFTLGAANDFLGYMVRTQDQYNQALREGLLYLIGCPEEAVLDALGVDYDGACPDHWALMVSPTIGPHLLCALQNSADDLGFTVSNRDALCPLLTAFDNQLAPAEFPNTSPLPASPAQALLDFNAATARLVESCSGVAPDAACSAVQTVQRIVAGGIEALAHPKPPIGGATGVARAGVAQRDASWHLGASAGQFAATGVGVARTSGFDPYMHSVRKVGSDTLGTRVHTRALVVEDGEGNRVGVVANDLYLPNDLLHRRISQLLREHDLAVSLGAKEGQVTRLSAENLAMTVSHSHTSPFYSTPAAAVWIFQDVFDLRFYEYMARQMADAVIEAVSELRPVRMGGITVHSNDVAGHTYGPKTGYDGTPAGQPYDYTTQDASIVRFDDVSDPSNPVPYANWVIFGVHPEWVWGEEIVNGDLTHAVMRMLDRETGAMTVMSQRETGTSGPHKDRRVHQPQDRHEFQESNFSGYDRAARLLTDTLKDALQRIVDGRPQNGARFAALSTDFRVAHASQRFAPPLSQPLPMVSNCLTDPLFAELHPGVPLVGFPDCFYDVSNAASPVIDPLVGALPVNPDVVRQQLLAAGVPVPATYGFPSLLLLEETATVHLQVFKLGDIAALFCPCEQFTSQALNMETRLDRVAGNLWNGYDWTCLAESRGELPADPRFAAHCARQQQRYPETSTGIPGSFEDAAKVERLRAQIHNDARGWEDPAYALWAQSEPPEAAEIKGNFTQEEFTESGYGLVLSVGMANDYWGYMPEYREFRAHDHYRKALNGLGQHGADFLATRLTRLAAGLNGVETAMPFNPLDV
ncbi:MAG TPA: Ig-like domain-containing protein, partial [Solimonas sp.]